MVFYWVILCYLFHSKMFATITVAVALERITLNAEFICCNFSHNAATSTRQCCVCLYMMTIQHITQRDNGGCGLSPSMEGPGEGGEGWPACSLCMDVFRTWNNPLPTQCKLHVPPHITTYGIITIVLTCVECDVRLLFSPFQTFSMPRFGNKTR